MIDEIFQATGIDFSDRYTFRPPGEVDIFNIDASLIAQIQTIIDNHVPDTLYFQRDINRETVSSSKTDFKNLPNWATWTGPEAADFVHNDVLSGMDKTQVDAYIDANITDLASAKDVLKLLAEEVVDLRNIVEKAAQAIMYLRDITIER